MAHEHFCRFNAVFEKLGPTVVDSHTATIKTEFRDMDTLAAAVKALGGSVLGMGTHRLYSESKAGFGFTLPGWRYPIICQSDGTLAFDAYNGAWGNVADLERLKSEYVIATAEMAAQAQGWLTERNGGTLTIHHPSGGTLTVTANGAEAIGFLGTGCHEALMSLNLPMAELVAKPEYTQAAVEVRQGIA
jgi:hypothetical protein